MSLFLEVPENELGRDFVVSDIHGCFSDLEELLVGAGFDEGKDRVFCVGDLIDRGPESQRALEFLEKDWFFSVRGNHEDMALNVLAPRFTDKLRTAYSGRLWSLNGGNWFYDMFSGAEDMDHSNVPEKWFNALHNLPVAIQVSVGGKRVGIVHAEVPTYNNYWGDIRKFLSEYDYISGAEDPLYYALIWSRDKYSANKFFDKPGKASESVLEIEHVFHGHTIVPEVQVVGNCTYMDTGSFLKHWEEGSGRITLIDMGEYLNES